MTAAATTGQGLDAEAFEALARASAGDLYRFALSLCRSPADASDLVQEAFLRAWSARSGFRHGASPETWLRRILHNAAVDRGRRARFELAVPEVEGRWRDDAYTVDPVAVVERARVRADLEDALIRLPFIYRATLVLHDVEGWTLAEIADLVGIGLPASKQRLRRGRMMLVTALAGADERRLATKGVPMRCWDARRLVSEYLDERLDDARRGLVEAHLAGCPTCPPLYSALVGVTGRLSHLRDDDATVPPGLAERITARIGAHTEKAAD